ncbi:RNA polymerase sigma factor [bacterium]
MKDISDHDLMLAVKDGDLDKMGLLFERYHQKVYNLFLWQTQSSTISEDLVQELFLRMLRSRKTYRGEGKFTTWMFSVARSARMDYYRKNKKKMSSLDNIKEIALDEPSQEDQVSTDSDVALLHQAMAKLPAEKREVLVMSRFQNMKYQEISKVLKCSVGTIKSRIFWAIRDLGKIYREMGGDNNAM